MIWYEVSASICFTVIEERLIFDNDTVEECSLSKLFLTVFGLHK